MRLNVQRCRGLEDLLRLFLALVAVAGFAHAQDPGHAPVQALFLDDSGSMKSYFASGLIRDIAQPLQASIGAQGSMQLFAFSTAVSPARSLEAIEAAPFGQFTYLDKVIETSEARHIDIAWIVTDNIEDTGEQGNTDRFYARLRSPAVHRVTVFPVRAQAGHPGLVIYALLFNPAADATYNNTLKSFVANGSGILRTEPLLMKPVDKDTVEVTSRDLAPLTRRGGPKVYDTGDPINAQVEVRFRSRFDHIEIVDSALHIVDAAPAFGPDSLLRPSQRQLAITPNRIRDLGPGGETAQVYRLSANLGELQLKNSPAAWWQAAWGKPEEEAQLPLTFAIDVPQQNFRLRKQFLDQWSAPTVAEARATGKVYAIDKLLSSINAADTHIQVNSPLFFRVRYPSWPAVLWIALFALALGALIAAAFFGRKLIAGRQRAWHVQATTPEGQMLTARLQDARVLVEEQPLARLEGKELLPIAPARFAAGRLRAAVVAGKTIRLVNRTQQIDLLFSPAKQPPSTSANAGPPAFATGATRPSPSPRPNPSGPRPAAPPRRR